MGSNRRGKHYNVGADHPQWTGGRIIDKDGYVLLHNPTHPNANSGGYVREHRFVMEKKLGRFLLQQEVVHHVDGDKKNNHIHNLELFAKNGDHLTHELVGRCPKWSPAGRQRILVSVRKQQAARRGKFFRVLAEKDLRRYYVDFGWSEVAIACHLETDQPRIRRSAILYNFPPMSRQAYTRLTPAGADALRESPLALKVYETSCKRLFPHLKKLLDTTPPPLSQMAFRRMLELTFPRSRRLHGDWHQLCQCAERGQR